MSEPPRARPIARLLAALALLAASLAVWAVGTGRIPDVTHSPSSAQARHEQARPRRGHHTYRVKPSDTLSAIAIKNHVSTRWLLRVNPDLDSHSLQIGQVIKLTR